MYNKCKRGAGVLLSSQIFKTFTHVAQLLLFVWVTYKLVQIAYLDKGDAQEFSNSYCRNNDCDLEHKFDKIIYFWCDGISYDTANPIFQVFQSNAHIFRVAHDSAPWSAAVLSTYFTGKTGKNMGLVSADNILNQLSLSGLKAYLGAEQTEAYVLYGLNKFVDGEKMQFYPGVVSDDIRGSSFSWLFDCDGLYESSNCMERVLNTAKDEKRSFFFESFLIDHKLHFAVDNRHDPIILTIIKELGRRLELVKAWVDNNPEYLLVIVSDHGGKLVSSDLHGPYDDPNNYAWNLFYNPEIKPLPENPVIKAGDVAATMWQYISSSGVSIPAESIGVVGKSTQDPNMRLKTLKINAQQLLANAKRSGVRVGEMPEDREALEKFLAETSAKLKDANDFGLLIMVVAVITILQIVRLAGLTLFPKYLSFLQVVKSFGFLYTVAPYAAWLFFARFTAGYMWGVGSYPMYIYVVLVITAGAIGIVSKSKKYKKLLLSMTSSTKNLNSTESKKPYISLHMFSIDHDEKSTTNDDNGIDDVASKATNEQVEKKDYGAWDYLVKKQYKAVLVQTFRYILGSTPIKQAKPQVGWVLWYAVAFGIFVTMTKVLILEAFLFTSTQDMSRPISNRVLFALFVLFFEFRWQRRLLVTFLNSEKVDTTARPNFISRIFNALTPRGAMLPLYIKFIVYSIVLYSIFKYHAVFEATKEIHPIWFVYYTCFIHMGVLVFCPGYLQRDLFLPLYMLLQLISSPYEQMMTSFYAICVLPLSNTTLSVLVTPKSTNDDVITMIRKHVNRHIFPYTVFLVILTAHFFFQFMMGQVYSVTDGVSLFVPGIEDVTLFPKFSVAMMIFHKLGLFFLAVPVLIRMANPGLPVLKSFKIMGRSFGHVPANIKQMLTSSTSTQKPRYERVSEHEENPLSNNTINTPKQPIASNIRTDDEASVMWETLLFFGIGPVIFYIIIIIQKAMDEAFVWTIAVCLIVCLYGITFIIPRILLIIIKDVRNLVHKITKS